MSFEQTAGNIRTRRALLLALICVCIVAVTQPLIAAGARVRPTWTVQLKKYGFRGSHRGVVNDPGSFVQIAFSRNAVAVLFNDGVAETSWGGTGSRMWLGQRLVGLFLDARTGEVLGRRSWIAGFSWALRNDLFPTGSGDYALLLTKFPSPLTSRTDVMVRSTLYAPHSMPLLLLSASGNELKRIELPVRGAPAGEYWDAAVSPSGRSLLLTHTGKNLCDFVIIDPSTLEPRRSWTEVGSVSCSVASVSDDQVLLYAGKGQDLIEKFGGPLEPINLPAGRSQFLNDDQIITFGRERWGLAWIMGPTGQLVSVLHLPIHYSGRGIPPSVMLPFVSGDGRRFGAITEWSAGFLFVYRWEYTLDVWQRAGDKIVFQIPLAFSPSQQLKAALSMDGSQLAVVDGGRVSLYALPAPIARQSDGR